MTRQKLLNTLLIASFGAMATVATAQTPTPAQNNTPRNAPVGDTVAPSAAGSAGTMAPGNAGMGTMGNGAMDTSVPTSMNGYKSARAACDTGAMDMREKCRTTLNTRYGSVAPKCQKLSGSALDDCLKGADTGQ